MSASLDQIDLAKNLAALASVLDKVLLPKMRDYAAGLVTGWSTPEKADDLAAVLEETARRIRLYRPITDDQSDQEDECEPDQRPPSTWKSALSVRAVDSTPAAAIPTVRPVADLVRSPSGSDCPDCDGTGVMRWQQPTPDGHGATILREMEHPCPQGCGGEWKQPHAEHGRVVDARDDAPAKVQGQAAAANRLPPALGEALIRIYERHSRS